MNSITKRIVSLVLALFLIAYVGYQAYLVLYSDVEWETVESYTVYETLDVQGVAVRDEKVIGESVSGYLYYEIKNGDRVAKDGVIAEVYSSEEAALLQKQKEQLDREIEELEWLQLQSGAVNTDVDSLNKQIKSIQKEMLLAVRAGEIEVAEDKRSALQQLLNRKQIVVGNVSDFTNRLVALRAKRESLLSRMEKSQKSITSPAAGYFIAATDGYESMLSYQDVSALQAADVEAALSAKVTPTDGVGKVVGDYVWYLACVVPQEKLSLITVGQHLSIRLPFVTNETVPVTVHTVNVDNQSGRAMVLLECSYMSEELSSVRCEEVRILLREYTGLYVPDRALHFNEQNEPGVYVRVGNVLGFRHIDVLYYDEVGKFSVCAIEPPADDSRRYLKLYDDIVVGGKELYDGKVVT